MNTKRVSESRLNSPVNNSLNASTRCPLGDPECAPTCLETASEAVRGAKRPNGLFLSESACAGDDYACRLIDCEAELTACFGPPILPTGTTTCTALSDCIDACDSDDTDCGDVCLAAASPEGYNQFFDVFYCAQDNACDTLMDADAYAQCMRTNCDAELTICTESGLGQGTLSCEEIYDCADLCPAGDTDCTRDCLGSASQEGFHKHAPMNHVYKQMAARIPTMPAT